MPNSIVTNTAANTALRYLQANSGAASSSVAKLSSGSRIVKASDDAASLTVGTKLKADVAALKQAQVNTSQASSLLQVADGGMARIADILQRMKQLAVQASSGSLTNTERAYLNEEFTQLRTQVTDVADQTKFNGQALLNGSLATTVTVTDDTLWDTTGAGSRGISVRVVGDVGPTSATFEISFKQDNTNGIGTFTLAETTGTKRSFSVSIDTATNGTFVVDRTISFDAAGIELDLSNFVALADGKAQNLAAGADTQFTVNQAGTLDFQVGNLSSEKISVTLSDLDATGLKIAASTIDTQANANTASMKLDTAIQTVNAARASVGALMSRFEAAAANLATGIENIEAARSTLMDVDVAAEMAKFTSAQVLMQANVAMLAQANQMPQNLLRLLQ
ncbi:MAG: flagellin [Geminicoccaceae bacterium]|nr:flagellin [Geminicoccaceae bacterium]